MPASSTSGSRQNRRAGNSSLPGHRVAVSRITSCRRSSKRGNRPNGSGHRPLTHGAAVMTSLAEAARPAGLSRSVVHAAFIELVATAFLLIAVVGSGIMAERLSGGNVALALLANAVATGGALTALILAFGPQSGAHMNPVVTLAAAATD